MKSSFMLFGFLSGLAAMLGVVPMPAATRDRPDQPLSIIQTTEPVVKPAIGEALPESGIVRLLISVDATGKLADWMTVDYDDSRYAAAAEEALKQWRFVPAKQNGTPVGVRTMLYFTFETRGQVVSMTGCESSIAFIKSFVGGQLTRLVCRANELDAIPKPTVVVSPQPVLPKEMADFIDNVLVAAIVISPTPSATSENVTDEAKGITVDFYIDENGRPRMPTVNSHGNEMMAASAVEALEQWRFTPPMRKGVPVAVRATQWFDFSKTDVASK